ncbi:MAG: hypothetical protein IJ565_05780 [Bacilli bacterium]|nr:hypothetical protein [Bacilli bacterium]
MKKFIKALIFVGIIYAIVMYRAYIVEYAVSFYNSHNKNIVTNKYTKNQNFASFQRTSNYTPKNKQDLINLMYTILDNGMDNFVFACSAKYENCADDMKDIAENGMLQVINNYVHPYNSYNVLNYSIYMNLVNVSIEKLYSENEIASIDSKINLISNYIITSNMSDYDKIRAFHDYIINNTTYDDSIDDFASHRAYNVVMNGVGVCGGYADTMAIFLEKLQIKNFKLSNEEHIWNVLYFNNNLYHIDMTWDDPITPDKSNMLLHDYFMITSKQLIELNDEKHIFDANLYVELK